jgi:alkylation response protein AidB-like acyl-CoA dehydrogenase
MTTAQDSQVASFPDRARAVGALADTHAAAADREGRLAAEVVDALHEQRLFGIWVPRALGGGELPPHAALQVIDHLAYGDPSTAWVLMASALAIGTGAAYLDDQAVKELFGGPRFPVIVGQGTRPGVAVRHDGGFLLSGAWSFASGIRHATHIHTLAVVEGTNEARIFVLPVDRATLIDNWDVLGLRATGSLDYTNERAFVPEGYSHMAATETPRRGGALYRIGIIGFAAMCHSGWACGVGRRLLDELAAGVRARGGRGGVQAKSDSFLEHYARVEATHRAARALVMDAWRGVQDTIDRGDAPSVRQHTEIRLAMAHVTWAAHAAAVFRDVHAGTQHLLASPPVFRECGRELAGLAAPGQRWRFVDLVDDPER